MNKETFERRKKIKDNLFFHLKHIWINHRMIELTEKMKKEIWSIVHSEMIYSYSNGYRAGYINGIKEGVRK